MSTNDKSLILLSIFKRKGSEGRQTSVVRGNYEINNANIVNQI